MIAKDAIDKDSQAWQSIKQIVTLRLEKLRIANDGMLTAEQTALLRGRIMELKEFLALDKPAPDGMADEQ